MLARAVTKFPEAALLKKMVERPDPMVYVEHYLGQYLRKSRHAADKRTPEELWESEDFRRDFFMKLLEADPKYYVREAELYQDVRRAFNWILVTPPVIFADAITKLNPMRILDIDVGFGSVIVGLAMVGAGSARLDGLSPNSAIRPGLQKMISGVSADPSFYTRINLVLSSIEYYHPEERAYDLVIVDVRGLDDVIFGRANLGPLDEASILSKAKIALAPSGTLMIVLHDGSGPSGKTNILELLRPLGFKSAWTKQYGEHTAHFFTMR